MNDSDPPDTVVKDSQRTMVCVHVAMTLVAILTTVIVLDDSHVMSEDIYRGHDQIDWTLQYHRKARFTCKESHAIFDMSKLRMY